MIRRERFEDRLIRKSQAAHWNLIKWPLIIGGVLFLLGVLGYALIIYQATR